MKKELKVIISIILFVFFVVLLFLISKAIDWTIYDNSCPCIGSGELFADCFCYKWLSFTIYGDNFWGENINTVVLIAKTLFVLLPSTIAGLITYAVIKKMKR